MKPIGYFRISSEDTALDKFAVSKYEQKFIRYGIPEEYIFYDFSSGGNTDRKGYKQAIGLIKSGKRDELVVPMQSRLNRNLINSELLAEDLVNAGAKLTVLETGTTLDLTVPAQRLLYQIQAIFDHQALSTYKQQAIDNGKEMRRQKKLNCVPFGYVLVRGKPAIDTEPFVCMLDTKEVKSPSDVLIELISAMLNIKNLTQAVRQIHAAYGVPDYIPQRIARNKGKKHRLFDFSKDTRFKHKKPIRFSHNTVKKLFSNPLLVGDVNYFWRDPNKVTVCNPNAYPEAAIISRQNFERLQTVMGFRDYKKPKNRNFPLTGLTYCASCGGRYYSHPGAPRKDGSRTPYYYCSNSKNGCKQKSIKAEYMEREVVNQLMAKYQEISALALEDIQPSENPEIAKLEAEIIQLEAMNSDNDYIRQAISENRNRITQIRLEDKLGGEVKQENIELLRSTFSNRLYWETLPDLDKKEIYNLLIKRIVIGLKDEESYIKSVILKV